jgi:hypothetical protein
MSPRRLFGDTVTQQKDVESDHLGEDMTDSPQKRSVAVESNGQAGDEAPKTLSIRTSISIHVFMGYIGACDDC